MIRPGASPSIRIEPARALDALPTLALHRDVLAEGRWFVTQPHELAIDLASREREIAALDAAENGWFLVARLPGVRVAGYLTVHGGVLARMRHVGRIELMVDRAHRGAGVGRALLRDAIERARRSGVLTKLSLAVLADNERALGLYRSLGFAVEGRRTGEYREPDGTLRDDVLMALALGSDR